MFADVLRPAPIFESNIRARAELAAMYGDPAPATRSPPHGAPNGLSSSQTGASSAPAARSRSRSTEAGRWTTRTWRCSSLSRAWGANRRRGVKTTQVAPSTLYAPGLEPADITGGTGARNRGGESCEPGAPDCRRRPYTRARNAGLSALSIRKRSFRVAKTTLLTFEWVHITAS